jgi:hypothetical protein
MYKINKTTKEEVIFKYLEESGYSLESITIVLFKRKNLSKKVIDKLTKKFRSELEWQYLCDSQQLGEKLIRKYLASKKIDFFDISSTQKYSEKFFWEFSGDMPVLLVRRNKYNKWIKFSKKFKLLLKLQGVDNYE